MAISQELLDILACPKCKGLAKYMTLVSGNTFGARLWTDGKQVAPMLPLPPAVVKCLHCGECYWLAKAKRRWFVGLWMRWMKPAWAAVQGVQEPTEEQYHRAIERGLATTPEQEKDLRVLAWWRGNDAFREAPIKPLQPNRKALARAIPRAQGPWRKNLEALTHLLDETDETGRLMKVEVLRELGQFESAKQLLSCIDSSELAAVVGKLHSLCTSGDTCVRELRFDA